MRSRQSTEEYDDPPPSASSSSTSFLSADYTILSTLEIEDELVDLTHPYTGVLDLESGRKADGLSFQPCRTARNQDRYIIEQFAVRGGGEELWTLTGIFDGHLGEATVEHVAHHLPIIIREHLEELVRSKGAACIRDPATISALLKRAFIKFDGDIANDVLGLFPGGISSLDRLSDDDIRSIIIDHRNGLQNHKKVQLNMYGTTALLALIDPLQENLWIANLGDCQAVLASRNPSGNWVGELLTQVHNGTNPREVERVKREHPGEPECVVNGRILGFIEPFRCIGDQAFKQPIAFTRRILLNLVADSANVESSHAAWAQLASRIRTPPYLSIDAEITHLRLRRHSNGRSRIPNQFLILCTDGLPDLLEGMNLEERAQFYVNAVVPPGARDENACFSIDDSLALRILKKALGGEDNIAVSQMIAVRSDVAWLDDVTIVVQIL